MNNNAVPPLTTTPSAATTTTVQPRDRRRYRQAIDRLHDDAADRDQQQPGIEQGRQDRSPGDSHRCAAASAAFADSHTAPHARSSAITSERLWTASEIQRQRIGRIAEDQLGNDERRIERGADGKRPAEIVRRMAVAGVTMGNDHARGSGCDESDRAPR